MTIGKINSFTNHLERLGSAWWGMLILSSIPFLVILTPLLFGGQIFLKGDLIDWVYPVYDFYKDSLARGDSIFWNPNVFSGFPSFIGSMGFLSPLHYLLFQALPLFTAYNLIILINVTLGLFFTWRLLQKFKLSFWAGFIGGLVYVFSQWVWVHDLTISNALPILPLLFLILWRVKEKNDYWSVVFGGLLVGWGWLSVHFNWLVMILSAGFLFCLWLFWNNRKKWSIILKFVLMVLLGTLIGLFIIWPLLSYSPLSARSDGVSYQEAVGGAISLGDFLRYLLPYFKISFFNLASSSAQLYLGILPLFFLIFIFKFRSSLTNFFIFLFSLCLLTSISYSPFFWFLHQLPVFSSFRAPGRWMFIGSFAAAILAGFGAHYFLTKQKDIWKEKLLRLFKWVSWLILAGLVFISLVFYLFKNRFISLAQDYFDKYVYSHTSGLSIEYYHRFIEGVFNELEQVFSIFNPRVFLSIFFIFISYFILNYFHRKKSILIQVLPIVALVIFINFLFIFTPFHSTISKNDFVRQPATVKFIKQDLNRFSLDEGDRIFSFLPGFSQYNKLTVPYQSGEIESFIFQSEMIAPNLNLFYDLKSVDYYDNLMSRPMSRILALIGSDRATFGEKLADLDITTQEKTKKLEERKNLLNLLGVRYIISAFPLNEEIFPLAFETRILSYNIPIMVYQNQGARPLFYLADKVEVIEPNEERAYQKLLEESLEGKSIFIECLDCQDQLDVDGQGEITLIEKKNSFVHLEVKSASYQWLIFSENYLPGWQAYLDNDKIEIHRVNSVYMGILILEGEHQILFRYNLYSRL